MSDHEITDDDKEVLTTTGREARRGSFGPGGGVGMPTERSKDFKTSLRRLGTILGGENQAPGHRRRTHDRQRRADRGRPAPARPGDRHHRQRGDGSGIDFGALHDKLFLVAGLYAAAWLLGYTQAYILAGVLQRAMFGLRESVEHKINRLPLALHRQPVARRPAEPGHQRHRQPVAELGADAQPDPHVAADRDRRDGDDVHDLAADGDDRTGHGADVGVADEGDRNQGTPRFMQQWRHTGSLNAQAEEVFTGHAIVKTFGRQRDVEARFREDNDELYEASYMAQFTASLIQPMMVFMGNIQFILIAVVGGLRISSGAMSVGDMQALIQYARQFSQPLTHLASMTATFQSGIASLERVLELLDAEEQIGRAERHGRSRPGAWPDRVRRRVLLL